MITGIGTDLIEIGRIKKLIKKNPRFIHRIFTPQEIHYCQEKVNKYQHFAARFAAKEAFFKALGRRIKWKDVGMTNHPSGKPELEIYANEKFPFDRAYVSIAHISEYALAMVILESTK